MPGQTRAYQGMPGLSCCVCDHEHRAQFLPALILQYIAVHRTWVIRIQSLNCGSRACPGLWLAALCPNTGFRQVLAPAFALLSGFSPPLGTYPSPVLASWHVNPYILILGSTSCPCPVTPSRVPLAICWPCLISVL